MLFRNDQHMHRPCRIDVIEGKDILVLINFFGWNLAINDLAENAVAHLAPREAFSSMPEMPSRRRISCDTSSMLKP